MRIVWLCDCEGWAYDARVNQLIPHLPEHEHKKIYLANKGWLQAARAVAEGVNGADVVVCLYLRYMELLQRLDNAVVFLGGMRPFE